MPARFPLTFFEHAADSLSLSVGAPSTDTLAAVEAVSDSLAGDSIVADSAAAAATHAAAIPSVFDTVATGMLADPAPYHVGDDYLVSSLLMGGLLLAIIGLAFSWRFVAGQVKNFFYLENERTTPVPDTVGELVGQGVLVVFEALLLGIAFYCYSVKGRGVDYWVLSRHTLLGTYLLSVVAYFLFKAVAYQFVNWVFFDVKKIEQWNKSLLFLTAMEGMVMGPVVMMMLYGGLPLKISLAILLCVAFLVKILTFYKGYLIFFRRMGAFLQNILYFCALELTPLAVLLGLMEAYNNNLEINF